ncbi:hypothetical protein VTH82DRAFT_7183 [Thermothelomyces myriococcoides]
MRATATVLFIASLASTALGAATKFYSDANCENEIGKKVYNGFDTGDAPIPKEAVAIKTDSIFDVWFAYQKNDGEGCKGDLILRLHNDECYNLEKDLGYAGCTRLCTNGLGGGECASSPA